MCHFTASAAAVSEAEIMADGGAAPGPGAAHGGERPEWLREGIHARWWSKSQNKHLEVTVSKMDEDKKRVVVTFDADPSAWKSVPFHQVGGSGPLQPPESTEAAALVTPEPDEHSPTGAPPKGSGLAAELKPRRSGSEETKEGEREKDMDTDASPGLELRSRRSRERDEVDGKEKDHKDESPGLVLKPRKKKDAAETHDEERPFGEDWRREKKRKKRGGNYKKSNAASARGESGKDDAGPRKKKEKKEKAWVEKTNSEPPKEKGEKHEPAVLNARVALIRERTRKIYEEHNPSKMSEIDSLFAKYAGVEEEMYRRICTKYGVTPEPLQPAGPPAPKDGKDTTSSLQLKKKTQGFAKKASAPPPELTLDEETAELYRRYRAMLDGA